MKPRLGADIVIDRKTALLRTDRVFRSMKMRNSWDVFPGANEIDRSTVEPVDQSLFRLIRAW
jgi:hypothetical protein